MDKLEVRLWANVAKGGPDDCWPWTAGRDGNGYGVIRNGGRQYKVHRVIYELTVGPIPEGRILDHRCHNTDPTCRGYRRDCSHRACCNPAHLTPSTHQQNLLAGKTIASLNKAKTHCKHGHEFTEANTRRVPHGRRCRACHRGAA